MKDKSIEAKMKEYAMFFGYGVAGFVGITYYSYKIVMGAISIRRKSPLNEQGKRIVNAHPKLKTSIRGGGIFLMLYSVGLWQMISYSDIGQRMGKISKFEFTPQQIRNPQFQESYLIDMMRYFKISDRLIEKTQQELKRI